MRWIRSWLCNLKHTLQISHRLQSLNKQCYPLSIKLFWIRGRIWSCRFLCIFTEAFLLFRGGFKHAGYCLTLTKTKITPKKYMLKYEETRNFGFYLWSPFSIFAVKINVSLLNSEGSIRTIMLKLTLNSFFSDNNKLPKK